MTNAIAGGEGRVTACHRRWTYEGRALVITLLYCTIRHETIQHPNRAISPGFQARLLLVGTPQIAAEGDTMCNLIHWTGHVLNN